MEKFKQEKLKIQISMHYHQKIKQLISLKKNQKLNMYNKLNLLFKNKFKNKKMDFKKK